MQINTRAPKGPPIMGPIGSSDFEFPCTKTVTVATPGTVPDVGLNEEDCDVVDKVLVVIEDINEVVDDKGGVALLTEKKSRNNRLVWLLLYSMVNTWEASGRMGDWKSSWRHCVLPVSDSLIASLTGVPPSML
jgi:hypothetical protein